MKKALSIILSLLIAFSALAVIPVGAAEVDTTGVGAYRGTTGTCSWSVNNRTLYINGNGAMADYSIYSTPWYEYRRLVTSIVIGEGVTRIGNYAFVPFENAVSVSLPSTLKYIGENAFSCTGLYDVEIPDSVTDIGGFAFSLCTSLVSIKLPKNMETIENGVFWRCRSLNKVVFPEGLKTIKARAFESSGFTRVDLSGTQLEKIEEDGFYNCTSLKKITLPRTIESIAFCSLGFVEGSCKYTSVDGYNIRGYKGTIAENYVKSNTKFVFTDIESGIDYQEPNPSNSYVVSFDNNYESGMGGSGSMDDVYVRMGDTYILPENGFNNYLGLLFDGWEIKGEKYAAGDEITVNSDITVKAIWRYSYHIQISPNGGFGKGKEAFVDYGDYTLPENPFSPPTIHNYFDGWEIDGKKYQPGDTITPTGDVLVKALWREPYDMTVSFKTTTGSGSMDSVTAKEGYEYTIPKSTFTHPYKKFMCWSYNGKSYKPGEKIMVSENITLTAQWTDKTAYYIYFDSNGSYSHMNWDYIYEGDSYTVPTCSMTPPVHKKFERWLGSDKKYYAPGDKITLSSDITLQACWVDTDSCTVILDSNGGYGYMAPGYVFVDDIYIVPRCTFGAPEGKEFRCWSYDGENYAPGDYIYWLKKDITLKAIWKDQAAEYEYRVNDDGTMTFYRYRGSDSELFVPAEYNGTYVTKFGSGTNYAVYGLDTLERIIFPDGITLVNHNAVRQCENLISVTMSDTVAEIGRNSFMDNAKLNEVKMSTSLKKIGYDAFMNCPSLKNVTIPTSVTEIGSNAFGYVENPDYDGESGERYFKVAGFTISGYKGSAAQTYANENGFIFKVIEAPAVVTEEKTDKVTGVKAKIDSTVELSVSSVGKGSIAVETDGRITAAYDIKLKKDGKTVQPDGSVTVKIPCSDPEAKIYRVEDDNSLTDMKATYKDGYLVFTTDHFSLYIVAAPAAQKPDTPGTKILLGDVDDDGEVSILDATCIQRKLAGLSVTKYAEAAADSDGDGEVSILDATAIQRHLAGLSSNENIGKYISLK